MLAKGRCPYCRNKIDDVELYRACVYCREKRTEAAKRCNQRTRLRKLQECAE